MARRLGSAAGAVDADGPAAPSLAEEANRNVDGVLQSSGGLPR